MWSSDGQIIFYLGNGMMTEVTFVDGQRGIPRQLFEWNYTFGGGTDHYSVTEDGRFMALEEQPVDWPPTTINVVLNYYEELNRLVPTGGSQ